MKRILLLLLLIPAFSFAQPCADEDTVRANAASLITATTARINGTVSHFAGTVLSIQLRYVRVGQTDTATASASGTNPLRNLTGLQSATQYVYYYNSVCGSGTNRQLGTYTFTTLSSTVVYATERSTVFPYVKADTGFTIPRLDTGSLYRAADIGGNLRFRPADSLPYYYNGDIWKLLAVDSAGILPALNLKVDSVTVDSDTLLYWVNGTGYGEILPSAVNIYNSDGTIDGNRAVDVDGHNLQFQSIGMLEFTGGSTEIILNGSNDIIEMTGERIDLTVTDSLRITGLTNLTTQDRLLGIRNSNGRVGNVILGTGLSFTGGVLSNTGVTSTPTLQQVITAGNTLTGNNTIAGGGYDLLFNGNKSVKILSGSGIPSTYVQVYTDSLWLHNSSGNYYIAVPEIENDTAANKPLVYNTSTSKIGTLDNWELAEKYKGTVTSVSGTANQITSTGGTTPVLALASGGTLPGAWTGTTSFTVPQIYGSTSANGDLLIDGTSSATKATSYVDIQQVGGYVGINTGSSANNLAVPLHIGNGTYNPSVDPVLLLNRTITGVSGNAHGFVDASHVTRSGTIGYNSYDAFPRLGEGFGISFDHYAAFQARPIFNETGQTISDIYGLYSTMTNTAGTVNNYYAGYAANPSNSGTITNNYGFYTASLTSGANNYAFYSAGTTPSYFGGAVAMNTTATVTTSLRTPLLIGSTAANGTITLQGNNAGASNTAGNDNIIFNVGNTPIKAGAFLNSGTLKLGTTGLNGRIDLARTSDGVTIGSLYQNAAITTLETQSSMRFVWGTTSIMSLTSTGVNFDATGSAGAANSYLHSQGSFATGYRAITALRTLDATDHTINCTANTFTITLPTAVSITGRQYTIVNSGAGVITIGTTSSQTFTNINGTPTTLTLDAVAAAAVTSYTVVSNGANWIVTAKLLNP